MPALVTSGHEEDGLVIVGRVRRAVGLTGEVEAELYLRDVDHLLATGEVTVGDKTRLVRSLRPGKTNGLYVLRLAGCGDRPAAEELNGADLKMARTDLPPAPESRYHQFELVGFSVTLPNGSCLGEVSGIMETGANDVYAVRRDDGTEVLIPAIKDVITRIDTAGRVITIEPMPGLLD